MGVEALPSASKLLDLSGNNSFPVYELQGRLLHPGQDHISIWASASDKAVAIATRPGAGETMTIKDEAHSKLLQLPPHGQSAGKPGPPPHPPTRIHMHAAREGFSYY
eukprot:TRINITY_DN44284_c0_g1_i1.p1 TRINITY_DN44284_c0_g1~~TRINITY_DN44284_c0_g1_i1.p1  ORF type:complete len:107 (-),score=6.01 TRINITY_DN44284_c0_g1_i1:216-536(-)